MRHFLGIDPGEKGGGMLLDEAGKICWMCVFEKDPTGGIDYRAFRASLKELDRNFHAPTVMTYLERAVSFGMGGKSAFNYGKGFAAIEIALKGAGLPYTLIEPSKWTKDIFQGIDTKLKPKERGLIALERLFPDVFIPRGPRSGKPHEGLVDALFIAEFARRRSLLSS